MSRFGRVALLGGPPLVGWEWNGADRDPNISLTATNLTAANSTTKGGVRGDVGKSSGKWVYECVVNAIGDGNGVFIGIGTAAMDITAADVGDDAVGWAFRDSGETKNNAVAGNTGYDSFTANDAITVYFDADNGKVWWAKNGTIQGGGSPASGTSAGYSTGAITAYPAVSLSGSGVAGQVTLRYPTVSLPSGFRVWGL